jgi:hypothetical protein
VSCCLVREYSGHKDGIWEVAVARLGQPIIGTAAAGRSATFKLLRDISGTYVRNYNIALSLLLKL